MRSASGHRSIAPKRQRERSLHETWPTWPRHKRHAGNRRPTEPRFREEPEKKSLGSKQRPGPGKPGRSSERPAVQNPQAVSVRPWRRPCPRTGKRGSHRHYQQARPAETSWPFRPAARYDLVLLPVAPRPVILPPVALHHRRRRWFLPKPYSGGGDGNSRSRNDLDPAERFGPRLRPRRPEYPPGKCRWNRRHWHTDHERGCASGRRTTSPQGTRPMRPKECENAEPRLGCLEANVFHGTRQMQLNCNYAENNGCAAIMQAHPAKPSFPRKQASLSAWQMMASLRSKPADMLRRVLEGSRLAAPLVHRPHIGRVKVHRYAPSQVAGGSRPLGQG